MQQKIIQTINWIDDLNKLIVEYNIKNPMIVCGHSISDHYKLNKLIPVNFTIFGDFESNPSFSSVLDGYKKYVINGNDGIISIGGGSSIDVSKCIRNEIKIRDGKLIKHIAIPTTSGTGSESTQFAVIYVDKRKKSIDSEFLLPDSVILDCSFILSVPCNIRICTMLDALSQSIESWWSVKSTIESI